MMPFCDLEQYITELEHHSIAKCDIQLVSSTSLTNSCNCAVELEQNRSQKVAQK